MKRIRPLLADSYKYSHYKQYPEGTEWIFDYLESRGGKYPFTLFFGLQYYLKEFLAEPITKEEVEYASVRIDKHMGPGLFNKEGWMRIVDEFNGRMPLRIRAVKEGSIVPVKNVLMTLENTHPDFAWLPGQFETLFMKVWAPTTVATTSLMCKLIIKRYLEKTGDVSELPFKLHDFGYRGVSSEESAAITGGAHLINFMGTDTVAALEFLTEYYGADMAGFSIPASEHSTMTILGRDGEYKQMERFLDVYASSPIKACVSDSYNIYEAIDFWGTQKQKLIDQNAVLVVRPDSGDPVVMSYQTVERLEKVFGSTINDKGFKVLNHVRVIYGDGISSPEVIENILSSLQTLGYSASNIAFGMGGGLLQKCDRDTQKFAMKCSAATINGQMIDVYKDPITDPGKTSKRGILTLKQNVAGYTTVQISKEDHEKNEDSALVTVWENGFLAKEYVLDEIRALSERQLHLAESWTDVERYAKN